MKIKRALRAAHSASILFFLTTSVAAFADDLVSLDDPAPAANVAPSSDAEVAVDLGSEETFNPYTFARSSSWSFLPIAALILVGLHLMQVPKRKSKRKIDQAKRFFRGLTGEGTNSSILTTNPDDSDPVASDPKGGK